MSGSEEKNMVIAHDSTVTLHYRLLLEDGTVVDETFDEAPLSFTVGDGTLIQGLEEVLLGLTAGSRHTFVLGADQAFGWPDAENVHTLPRGDFGPEGPPEPGSVMSFSTPGGEEIAGTVLSLDGESVQVDFNHPLAGHTLTFEVEIVAVAAPKAIDP